MIDTYTCSALSPVGCPWSPVSDVSPSPLALPGRHHAPDENDE
jgi:hypothetical protein